MSRGDRLGRQWKIIQALAVSKQGKSIPALAEELGCKRRTVYRDLEALQLAGFPFYTETVNRKSIWRLLDTDQNPIPVPFNITEMLALYFSRGMLKVLKDTVFYDALENLFQKIKSTLPPALIDTLHQIEDSLQVGPRPYKAYGSHGEIIEQVNNATLRKCILKIVYYSMSRKSETRRKVAPYKVWYFNETFYLIGYCMLRKDIRMFALDRIKSIQETKEPFTVPDTFSLEGYLKGSFGVFTGDPISVNIWFSPRVAGYIKEKVWHESQEIQENEDGSVLFSAMVAGTAEIKFWVMQWGANARVLAPKSLITDIQEEIRGMQHNYDKC